MNDALKMQISAFVDGELSENESELLLRRLSQDAEMRRQVDEYLLIGRLIRREQEVPGMADLRHRIAAALGEERPVEAPAAVPAARRRFLKPIAGVAVAASVALVALIGLRQVEAPDMPGGALAARTAAPAGEAVAYTEPRPAAVERPSEMLMQYYLSHGATSADLGANGILTRLVALELREGDLVQAEPVLAVPEDPEEKGGTGNDIGASRQPDP